MNLLRKLKISKLTSVKFTDNERHLLSYIDYWLSDLIIYVDTDKPNYINYIKPTVNKKSACFSFQYDTSNNTLYIRYEMVDALLEHYNTTHIHALILFHYIINTKGFDKNYKNSAIYFIHYNTYSPIEKKFRIELSNQQVI